MAPGSERQVQSGDNQRADSDDGGEEHERVPRERIPLSPPRTRSSSNAGHPPGKFGLAGTLAR
jgi:hypothetical protein